MRIRTQLWASGLAAAAVAVAVVAGLMHVTRQAEEAALAQADAQEAARDVAGLLTLTLEYTLYGGQRALDQWRARHALLVRTVDAAVARAGTPPDALRALQRSVEPLSTLFDRIEQASSGGERDETAARRKQFLTEQLLTDMQEVVEARYRWTTAVRSQQASDQRLYAFMVLGAPALMFMLLVALAVMVGRRVLIPLARLQASADAVRSGQARRHLGTEAADEFGDMARAFDAMTLALQQQSAAREVSERHLRMVIDNVPGLIGYIDADRRYAIVNRSFGEWHGRKLEDIVGQPVASMYEPESFKIFGPQLERAFTGETMTFDADLVRRGRAWSMHKSYIPRFDEAGRVLGVYAVGDNITQLRRTERELRTLMDCSPLGMFHADPQGNCLYANPAWLRISGLSVAQSLGRPYGAMIHPDDRDHFVEAVRSTRDSAAVQIFEHRYLRPDGRVVWVRAHGAPLHDGDRVVGLIGTIEDISERRELDAALAARTAELAHSNDELEQFAYVASHDLQEPLRMVTSYTQLLLRRHRDKLDGDALEFLDFIDDGGRRAQALIGDLLSLARVNSQARPSEPVAVQAILADVLQGLKLLVKDSGAQITHDESLPTVSADPRQLRQLLHNLLTNALKFRGKQAPRVHVGAARDADGRWRIRVADNGIGIEPEFHARVFVLFQRLHLRSEYPGTGIGLALCKKVVERHGGCIGVESAPGQGSTFWFSLAAVTVATARGRIERVAIDTAAPGR